MELKLHNYISLHQKHFFSVIFPRDQQMVGVEVILTLVHSVFEDPSSDGNWNTESEPYEFLSRSGKMDFKVEGP